MSETDDLQIQLGDVKPGESAEEQPSPAEGLSTYVATVGVASDLSLPVYISWDAIKGIEAHVATSTEREVGGVLLGRTYTSKGKPYVKVDDFLKAESAGERRAALTFTHETWTQLNTAREQRRPELRIVGWYHSHPGLGIFMSDQDQFIHRNFFQASSMVAYVSDPVASNRAVFCWSGDRIAKASGFFVFADATRSREVDRYLSDLRPRQPEPRSSTAPLQSTTVRVVFREPAINLYDVLPGLLRRWFDVDDRQTAPRISLKTLLILVLLGLLVYKFFVPSGLTFQQGQSFDNHLVFARAFLNAGDYEEAIREYRRHLALHPDDYEGYKGLLRAIDWTSYSPSADRLADEMDRIRRSALDKAAGQDYDSAFRLLEVCSQQTRKDEQFMDVFRYLANNKAPRPEIASIEAAAAEMRKMRAAKALQDIEALTAGRRKPVQERPKNRDVVQPATVPASQPEKVSPEGETSDE